SWHCRNHSGHWQGQDGDLEGVAGLWRDKTRPSRIPPLSPEVAERVVALTLAGPPPTASHWTGAAMAKAAGLSVSSGQRIWRAHGLRPHLVRRFKLSNDPQFAAKLKEIVGLYVNPPNHAIVLSVDEKSQIQALDRTQPGLPMKKGRAGTITHDYKRHGVTTLFAALDVLEGKVIGQCMKRHRHNSPLAPHTKDPAWQQHARYFDTIFAHEISAQLSKVREFSKKYLTDQHDPMLYMFSGPDFLYATSFFPNASTYVLAGLEPVGSVPDLTSLSPSIIDEELRNLELSMGSLFNF